MRMRGLRWRRRAANEVARDVLARIDVCWIMSRGLAMIDPIRAAWDDDEAGPRSYAAGSWGPAAANALIARDGFAWHDES